MTPYSTTPIPSPIPKTVVCGIPGKESRPCGISATKTKSAKRVMPEFPDLLLCLGWVACNGGRGKREHQSAYLAEESTGEGVNIPYGQAVAMMKTRPLQFVQRISVGSVQEWVYRMVPPTQQSVLQELTTMLRCP